MFDEKYYERLARKYYEKKKPSDIKWCFQRVAEEYFYQGKQAGLQEVAKKLLAVIGLKQKD